MTEKKEFGRSGNRDGSEQRNDRNNRSYGERREDRGSSFHNGKRDDRRSSFRDGKRDDRRSNFHDGKRDDRRSNFHDGQRDDRRNYSHDGREDARNNYERDGKFSRGGSDTFKGKPGFKGDAGKPKFDRKPRESAGGEKRPRTAATLEPRQIALETLLDVSVREAYAQLALEKRLKQSRLDARDTAFITRIVYGTIERRITLDYQLDQIIEHDGEIEPVIREILRMGAYQILYMDRVPDMAAVNESVQLTRKMKMGYLAGFVNGVLRNLIRKKDELVWPKPEENPARYLSIMFSAPVEFAEMLIDEFGEHEALEILKFRPQKNYESIRPNLLRCDEARLRRLLNDDEFEYESGKVDGTLRVYNAGDMTKLRAYANGLFAIQGESSVLAARAVEAKPGQTILDACAAPGGKTAVISEMMQDTGRVYAWDTHAHRVRLIKGTAERLHIENIRPAMRDAAIERPTMQETLDAAIIDAPCSGSGVIGNKPDLKYRISREAVQSLCKTQQAILNAVSDMVKKGGTLVYSTCSIFKDENEQQIRTFLSTHPNFYVESITSLLPDDLKEHETPYGLQLFAHRDDMDGFYICKMKKMDFVSVK